MYPFIPSPFQSSSFILQLHSSIWTAVRDWREILEANAVWWVGDGKSISFWNDKWLQAPIFDMIAIDSMMGLDARVSDFIRNRQWHLPPEMTALFPSIVAQIKAVCIPVTPQQDKLVWRSSPSGELSFKLAYDCVCGSYPSIKWSKKIWSACIPPSRSFVL